MVAVQQGSVDLDMTPDLQQAGAVLDGYCAMSMTKVALKVGTLIKSHVCQPQTQASRRPLQPLPPGAHALWLWMFQDRGLRVVKAGAAAARTGVAIAQALY
jgi:hypothetical protein